MDFQGKTVIVTGSARGIGNVIAEQFASLGANVMLSGTSDNVYTIVG
ncbi:MAG: SDR family NAD(P)-dependent oxidoreductase, partial [Clostridiaceae bacterium]|nr:SDR family NAD(P)-dependent oxidoreductase [Clostridiaceae bacterium]